jgi:signal transduction histidine kinase
MRYRSIRQVLGESSLERKCRVLFGVCLTFLIGGAFYFASSVSEGLATKITRSRGSDLIKVKLLHVHAIEFSNNQRTGTRPNLDYLQYFYGQLARTEKYQFEMLMLEDGGFLTDINAELPADEDELRILEVIQTNWNATAAGPPQPKTGSAKAFANGPLENPAPVIAPVFAERQDAVAKQYHYYEPIVFNSADCKSCHQTLDATGSVAASDPGVRGAEPFRVMKVSIPFEEFQPAINKARAVLIAAGLATVFLAMAVLYLVVRLVIVNPLKHLRMVSDEITSGNLDTRADIRTGDEFQALADSFNRMMRHLTDSQAGLQRLNSELDEKVDELAQLNIQLYQMNQLKGDFLANMSHELRTPLNSIIGFSELLVGKDTLDEKQRRYAQNIQKAGRLLLDMINDILDMAKMEAGKMEVRLSEFAIDKILEAQCDLVRPLAEEKNIWITLNIEPGLPLLFQDQGKVQQILTNLLSNAIKFTPEGGRITLGAHDTRDRWLELTVADTGLGIPHSEREIIFEKFRQGRIVVGEDNLTRKHSGTGLGLSIVRELCRLLGGEVSVESELGKGTTFTVLLPWSRAEIPRGESTANAASGDAVAAGWQSGLTPPSNVNM